MEEIDMESTISHLFRKRVMATLDKGAQPVVKAMDKVPSEAYLAVGIACCCAATSLALAGKTKAAIVCATWAPMTLLIGIFIKHKFD